MKDWTLSRQYSWPGKSKRGPLRYFLLHFHEDEGWRRWVTCWRPKGKWTCPHCQEAAPEEMAFVADLAGCESRQ